MLRRILAERGQVAGGLLGIEEKWGSNLRNPLEQRTLENSTTATVYYARSPSTHVGQVSSKCSRRERRTED